MRYAMSALVAVMLMFNAHVGMAATSASVPDEKAKPAATHAVRHATTGIVKSLDSSTLVITRSGTPSREMTFSVAPATHREGTIDVGTRVSVRYRNQGKSHVATAITAQPPKQAAASHKSSSQR